MSVIIEFEGVHKVFGDYHALGEINLTVAEHCFVCIVGGSGCGKTTLMNLVAGFERPSSGTVKASGEVVTCPDPRRTVVFQDHALFPWLTVAGNIEYGLKRKGMPKKEREEVVRHYVDLIELTGFEGALPRKLSGGMRQRVAIARALATDPDILLMDEPFGALDAQTRQLMQEDLMRLWDAEQKTVIFVTHSMDEAAYLSDRVLVMDTHPGGVREILDVPLPRPRDESVRRTPVFNELTAHMWHELRGMMGDPTAPAPE
jgi:NitT/TauT family transport system ATP-binding protein